MAERQLPIELDQEKLAEFCRRNHIIRLSLFGSVLTDKFGPDSDVDFLFEYDPEHVPTLFDVARMERELGELVGRKADLRTKEDLSKYFRDKVVAEAVEQFAA